jgi:hypothetical protein
LHYLLDLRAPRPSAGGRAYGQPPETDGESRLTLADEWRLFAATYPLPADIDRAAFIELGARYLQEADATERG